MLDYTHDQIAKLPVVALVILVLFIVWFGMKLLVTRNSCSVCESELDLSYHGYKGDRPHCPNGHCRYCSKRDGLWTD